MSSLNVIDKIEGIKPFSATVSKAIRLTSNHNTDINQLAALIKSDQAIAARVIQVANSPYYAGMSEIKTIDKAIIRIGFKVIRNILITVASYPIMVNKLEAYELDSKSLFENSMLSALIAQQIAKHCNFRDMDLAYTIGLFKDIGKTVLNEFLLESIDKVQDLLKVGDITLSGIEKKITGYTSMEVGYLLLSSWNFPKDLSLAIKYIEEPNRAEDNVVKTLASVIHLTGYLGRIIGANENIVGVHDVFNPNVIKYLGMGTKDIMSILHIMEMEIKRGALDVL